MIGKRGRIQKEDHFNKEMMRKISNEDIESEGEK